MENSKENVIKEIDLSLIYGYSKSKINILYDNKNLKASQTTPRKW